MKTEFVKWLLVVQHKIHNAAGDYTIIALYKRTYGRKVLGMMISERNKFEADFSGFMYCYTGTYDDMCQKYVEELQNHSVL